MANKEPKRKPSGCLNLTAYQAIKKKKKETEEELERFRKLLRAIFDICELSDFCIVGRINLKDKRTGKTWH